MKSPTNNVPRAARRAVALLFLMNGMLFATWVSRIPGIQASIGLSHGVLGLALLGMALGALVSMPAGGWLSARFGSAKVCAIAGLAYALGLPVLAMAPNAGTLIAVLFAFGAAHGAVDVAMNAQAFEVEEQYDRPIMSSFHALFSLGGLIGSATGGLIAAAGFTPLTHFSAITLGVVLTGAWLAAPALRSKAMALAHPALIAPRSEKRGFTLPPTPLLVLGLLAFCVMLGEGAMADWSGIYLRQIAGATEGMAAAGYSAFSIAMAIGRFLGDDLALRTGPVRLTRWGGAVATAGLGLALLVPSPAVALIGFAAVGAGFATIVPQVFSAAGRATAMAPGTAVAIVSTIGYFGFLLGPPIIGFVAELLGLRGALCLVVVTSATLAILAGHVGKRKRVSQKAREPRVELALQETL